MDYSDPSVGRLRLSQMSDNAKRIFQERYCLKGETIEEAVWRVAKHISRLDPEWEIPFFNHIATFTGVPNSPTFTGAGTPLAQLSACFTLDIEDSIESIMQTLKDATIIQKSGGGLGFNFSKIRPRNALIVSTNKPSQGVCSWIKMYDGVFNNILQSCFSGEMRIATDKGLIKAEDLNNRILQGERFKAWTHKGYRNITFTFPNGRQELYKVVTKKGVELEVTGNHKITTLDSSGKIALKRLEELYAGDEILLAVGSGNVTDEPKLQSYVETNTHNRLNTEIKLPTRMNEELAYILGFSYGDGYVYEGESLSLSVGEDETTIQERLVQYIKNQFNYDARIRQGDGRVKIITINSITVIEWLRSNGLLKQKSAFIHVPETIFQSSSLSMLAFVAGYFDADGSDRKKKGGYGFDSISLQMIKDVQQLLAYNGIVSHIFEQKRKKWSTLYRLIVSGGYFRNVFEHTIPAEKIKGVPSLKDYSNTYPNTVVGNTPNKYYDGIYSGNAERITYTSFKRTVENMLLAEVAVEEEVSLLNLVPDEILSIEPIGIEETYDFEVEEVHLLSGNGVYTSNSRRGANMGILRCDHPDIFDFIELKSQETSVTNFNISILFDKNFMTALQADKEVELWWTNPAGERVVEDVIPAKDIWHAFIQHTWQHSEPSALFEDNINRDNPLENVYGRYVVTNPCVTGDTLISVFNKWTDDEDDLQYNNCTEITMEDLYRRWQNGEKDIQVITDSRIQSDAYVDISNVFITGEKEVFEIKTSQGNFVKATANHLIMTQKGWVEVQYLTKEDFVYLCDRQYSSNLDRIIEIIPQGIQLVYDMTVPDAASFIANGIVVHNCSEIPMKEYESCNLSCIALDNFVNWEGDFRWDEFKEAIRVNTYLLNGIVDTNELPIPQIVEMNRKYRRIGNGITGLHDAMIKMGVPYTSPEGLQFIEKIMAYLTFYGMETSNEIAQERGIVFEDFEQSIYATGLKSLSVDYTKHIPVAEVEQLSENIRNYGLANTHVSMIAPTGTRSTVSDKGGYGVEPIFAYSYKRWVTENNDSDNRYSISVVPRIFDEYLTRYKQQFDRAEILEVIEDNFGSVQGLDRYFSKLEQQLLVDANSISPDDHVHVLAAAQVYTQQAISKCVTGDTLVLTENGLQTIESLSTYRVEDSFDNAYTEAVLTHNGLQTTGGFYYGGIKPIKEISLEYGYGIKGTPNHRIECLKSDGTLEYVRLDNLQIGDIVPIKLNTQLYGEKEAVLPIFDRGVLKPKHKDLDYPLQMSEDLAYILGCVTSEGSLGKNGVYITHSDRHLLEEMGVVFYSLFGVGYHIVKDTRKESVYGLQVNSRILVKWFEEIIGMQRGARNKKIPACILQASKDEQRAFLTGLFYDAYMTEDGSMFGIGLANLPLIQQIQILLANMGVFSRWSKTGPFAWTLTVAGPALSKLSELAVFKESWKTERMARGLLKEKSSFSLNRGSALPMAVTDAFDKLYVQTRENGSRKVTGLHTIIRKNCRMQRSKVHTLRNLLDIDESVYLSRFFQHDCEDIIYVAVTDITDSSAEVFDIAVPGYEHFYANGIVNHNTINCPHNTSVEELIILFEKAWELGCKGLTVYRNASRNKVVIETTKKQVIPISSLNIATTENSPESWDDMVCNLTDGTCVSCA